MKKIAVFSKNYWKEVLVLSVPVISLVATITYNCIVYGMTAFLLTM